MPIPTGVLAGLGAMLGWGISDYIAALASKRVSAYRAFILMTFVAAILSILLAIAFRVDVFLPWPGLFKIGILQFLLVFGTFSFFKGLEVGRVSLLGPLSSMWPVLTIFLSILLYKENPTFNQLFGAAAVITGILFATVNWSEVLRKSLKILSDPGVPWIFGAIFGWGIAYVFYTPLTRQYGWFEASFWSWVIAALILLPIVIIRKVSLRIEQGNIARWQILSVGTLSVVAWATYSFGVTRGLTSVVAPTAAMYSIVTAILAYLFLRERLGVTQLLGVAVALVGLLLLSLQ